MNIGSENNYGVNIYGSVPVGKKLNLRTEYFRIRPLYRDRVARRAANQQLQLSHQPQRGLPIQPDDLSANFSGISGPPATRSRAAIPPSPAIIWRCGNNSGTKRPASPLPRPIPFNLYVNQATAVTGTNFTLNSLRPHPLPVLWDQFHLEVREAGIQKGQGRGEGDSRIRRMPA